MEVDGRLPLECKPEQGPAFVTRPAEKAAAASGRDGIKARELSGYRGRARVRGPGRIGGQP
jgi:hypothetical protein